MAKIFAITGCPTGVAHTYMAAEALKKTAALMGHEIRVETQGAEGVKSPLSPADVAAADVVIVASDVHVDMARFAGKPMTAVPVSDAIRKTRAVIETALAEIPSEEAAPPAPTPTATKFLVGVTACPTGIAHTFMGAEARKKSAALLGHEIRIETQGSVGAKNRLTDEEVARADAVIVAADAYVDTARFGLTPERRVAPGSRGARAQEELLASLDAGSPTASVVRRIQAPGAPGHGRAAAARGAGKRIVHSSPGCAAARRHGGADLEAAVGVAVAAAAYGVAAAARAG
jgi:fructose-specific phosphotransferase system IIB component